MMKRFYPLLLIVLTCCFFSAPAAHGQFWKKIFKKEHHPKTPAKNNVHKEQPGENNLFNKKIKPEYPPTIKKDHYRIDVLMPLHLDQLVKDGKAVYKTQPVYVLPTVNFYEGLKIAADTLNGLGYKMDLYIHDITTPTDNIGHLLADPAFRKTDLIIGLLQSDNIPEIAAFAKTHHINFLSALSPSDADIKDNPYFILVQPTLSTHIEKLVEYALKKYPRQPKYLFYRTNTSVQKEAFHQLEQALKGEDYTKVNCQHTVLNKDSLAALLDSTTVNVIFMNILAPQAAEGILKTLAELSSAYRFAVFGMPSWKALKGIDQPGYYGSLNIFYTNPFYFELNSRPGQYITDTYKKLHGDNPSEMVFRGYETLYWMADLLQKYGTVFDKEIQDVRDVPFTRYEIDYQWSPKNDFLYLENKNLHIYKYQNGYFNVD